MTDRAFSLKCMIAVPGQPKHGLSEMCFHFVVCLFFSLCGLCVTWASVSGLGHLLLFLFFLSFFWFFLSVFIFLFLKQFSHSNFNLCNFFEHI
jgi:hypothetical protein